MGAFVNWPSTSSGPYMDGNTTWFDQNWWSNNTIPTYIVQPILNVLETARRALARTRGRPVATAALTPTPITASPVFAPRRTTIARGTVNWVHLGTRRPLRGLRAA